MTGKASFAYTAANMQTPLYLTADERKLFDGLSEALKDGWKVEKEMQNSYESEKVLSMRARMAARESADVSHFFKKWDEAKGAANGLPKLSNEQMLEFFFTLGATGISVFIDALLREMKTDDDIQGVAHLSFLRHRLLAINAATASAS